MEIQDNQKLYNNIKAEVNDIIKFAEFKEAFEFIKRIKNIIKEKNYEQNNPELSSKFSKLIVKLEWVALPFFSKKEILNLFNSHFQEAMEMEYFDLQEKLKHVLVGIVLSEERDKLKQDIREMLNKNKARLTSKKLLNGEAPTVENWIKNYTSKLGIGIVDSVKSHQYFINNNDLIHLDKNGQFKVKKFFSFYEYLKLSSATVAGFEGALAVNTPEFEGYIQDGKLEKKISLSPHAQGIFDIVIGKRFARVRSTIGPPRTEEEMRVEELKRKEEEYGYSQSAKRQNIPTVSGSPQCM